MPRINKRPRRKSYGSHCESFDSSARPHDDGDRPHPSRKQNTDDPSVSACLPSSSRTRVPPLVDLVDPPLLLSPTRSLRSASRSETKLSDVAADERRSNSPVVSVPDDDEKPAPGLDVRGGPTTAATADERLELTGDASAEIGPTAEEGTNPLGEETLMDRVEVPEDSSLEEHQYVKRAPSRSPGGDSVIYIPPIIESENHEEEDGSQESMPPPLIDLEADEGERSQSRSVPSRFFQSLEKYKGRESSASVSSFSLAEDDVGGTARSASRSSSVSVVSFSEEDNRIPVSASALAAQRRLSTCVSAPETEEELIVGPSSPANSEPQSGNSFHPYDWFLPSSSTRDDGKETDAESADSNKGEVGSTVGDSRLDIPLRAPDSHAKEDYGKSSGKIPSENSPKQQTETEAQSSNEKERGESRTQPQRDGCPGETEAPHTKKRMAAATTTTTLINASSVVSGQSVCVLPYDEQPTSSSPPKSRKEIAKEGEDGDERKSGTQPSPPRCFTRRTGFVEECDGSPGNASTWSRRSNASERTRQRREEERGIGTPPPRDSGSEATPLAPPQCPPSGRAEGERVASPTRVSQSSRSRVQPKRRCSRYQSVDGSRSRSVQSEEHLRARSPSTVDQRTQTTCPHTRHSRTSSETVDPHPVAGQSTFPSLLPPPPPPSSPWRFDDVCPISHSAPRDSSPKGEPHRQRQNHIPLGGSDQDHHQLGTETSTHQCQTQSDPTRQESTDQDPSNSLQQDETIPNIEPRDGERVGESNNAQNTRSGKSEFSAILRKHLRELQAWQGQDLSSFAAKDLERPRRPEQQMAVKELTQSCETPGPSSLPFSSPNVTEMEDDFPEPIRNNCPSCSMSFVQKRDIRSSEGTSQEMQMLFLRCNVFNPTESSRKEGENLRNQYSKEDENGSGWSTPTPCDEPGGFFSDVDGVDQQSSGAASECFYGQPPPKSFHFHRDRGTRRGSCCSDDHRERTHSHRHHPHHHLRHHRRKQSRPMSNTEREIRHLRRTFNPLIPFAPFARLVREYMLKMVPCYMRFEMRVQRNAILALREAAEMYLVQLFEDATLCTAHGNRVTLQPRDLRLVRRLRRFSL